MIAERWGSAKPLHTSPHMTTPLPVPSERMLVPMDAMP